MDLHLDEIATDIRAAAEKAIADAGGTGHVWFKGGVRITLLLESLKGPSGQVAATPPEQRPALKRTGRLREYVASFQVMIERPGEDSVAEA